MGQRIPKPLRDLRDSCSYLDPGLDGNETYGPFTNDTPNNWALPNPNAIYNPGSRWSDAIGFMGNANPPPENPQNPLTNVAVYHDYPWELWIGSRAFGSGVAVDP
ncbi:MAG TPA: hypothetical protein VKV74_10470 [Bryobacteraceae bacterium]|nr:hypothetical protein [Bryobacteraceae bacterium]